VLINKKREAKIPIVISDEQVYHDRLEGRLHDKLPFRVIDLFAGAGGLTAGFSHFFGHHFTPVWANDFNSYAAESYNANFGHHCRVGDIVDILDDPATIIPKADVVIGGPPCQGFSLLNKNKEGDARKQLWVPFMDVVRLSGADVFVMENVPELLRSQECREIYAMANSLGFTMVSAKLCAADYGVPQIRWRAFIVGCKFADPQAVFPPKKTHFPHKGYRQRFVESSIPYIADALPFRTVKDAIGDLPAPQGTTLRPDEPPLDLHFGRTPTAKSLERYRSIPEEGMNRVDLKRIAPELTPDCWMRKKSGGTDLFGRLWWNKPSVTIRTEFYKPEKGRYLHPVQDRPITHREAARIQSFPDEFQFTGSKVEIAKQIGNAVPCQLAARVADCVYALLVSKNEAISAQRSREAVSGEPERHRIKGQEARLPQGLFV
jgi:DNA (cytosine-5)-methyltransferase 1